MLRSLGAAQEEVNAIIEGKRKQILAGRGLEEDDQNMILAQLGIITAEDSSLDENEEQATSSDVVRAAVEEKKLSSPMLAEVIEAAVIQKDIENDTPELKIVEETDLEESEDALKEGLEGEEVKA